MLSNYELLKVSSFSICSTYFTVIRAVIYRDMVYYTAYYIEFFKFIYDTFKHLGKFCEYYFVYLIQFRDTTTMRNNPGNVIHV